MLRSAFVFSLAIVGGFFTTIYTLKIYIYCLSITLRFDSVNSFILAFLTISSIFIDQSLDSCFSFSSFSRFYSISFESLLSFSTFDSLLHFSLLFFFCLVFGSSSFIYLNLRSPDIAEYYRTPSPLSLFAFFIIHSSSSFFIPPFQYFFLLFSSFFFKGPWNCIEVFNGFSSCYSLYHIHYFSSFQLILLFFVSLFFSILY